MSRSDAALSSWLAKAKANWVRLAQFTAFVFLALPFVWPPPTAATDTRTAKAIAALIATAVIAMVVVAGVRWGNKRDIKKWSWIAALLTIAAGSVFFYYDRAVTRLTCKYRGIRVVIGTQLTPHAQKYSSESDITSCSGLLDDYVGKVEDVWTRSSLSSASTTLGVTYVALIGTLAGMVVAIMQLLGLVFESGLPKLKHAP